MAKFWVLSTDAGVTHLLLLSSGPQVLDELLSSDELRSINVRVTWWTPWAASSAKRLRCAACNERDCKPEWRAGNLMIAKAGQRNCQWERRRPAE